VKRGLTLARAENAATYALGLLVLVLMFVALAGPAQSLRVQTQALRQQLATVSPVDKTVDVSSDWTTLTGVLGYGPDDYLFQNTMESARAALARSFTAGGVPITAGAFDGLASSAYPVASGAAASAQAGAAPKVEVLYRDPLTRHTQLVAGRYSSAGLPPGQLGVTVTAPTAARFGLHPGSRLRLAIPAGVITLAVTAVARIRDPGATFWRFDPTAGTPTLNPPSGPDAPPYWVGGVLADPDSITTMQALLGSSDLNVQWELPVRTAGLRADQVPALHSALTRLTVTTPDLGDLADGASAVTVTTQLTAALATFLATQAEINTILALLFVSLVVTGAAVIAVAARMVAIRRGAELTVTRARGASLAQVAGRTLAGAAAVAVPAAAAGVALAFAAEGTGASSALGWVLAGLITATALAGPPLIAVWRHRRPAPAPHPVLSELTPSGLAGRRVPARRWIAEAAACVAAVAGLVVLHHQGLPAPGQSDLFLAITPVLVAVPVVLIVLRLYPLAVRGLLALTARARGATGFVALARASRSALTGVLPVFALVLGLTVAAFAGMVRNAITQGEVAASWQATGADVVISTPAQLGTGNTAGQVSPAIVRAFAAVPGVHAAAAVWRTTWQGPAGQTLTVLSVDPGQYAALTASTPFPRFPAARIARSGPVTTGGPVAALASPSAAAALGSGVATLTSQDAPAYLGPLRVRVSGQVTAAAADPGGGAYLIVPLVRLPGIYGPPAPQTLLLTGSGIDLNRLNAVGARDLPTATATFRSQVLAGLAGAPLQHGAGLIMLLAALAAAGLGLCTLVFGLALGAGERELTLARLTTMGHDRPVALVLAEAMPAVLAAAAAGVACALALPRLVGSAVDLAVFTGQGTPVPLRPDWLALGLPIAVVLLLAAATLTAETRTLRRRGVTGLLRAH
jgi:putative ABC transport system permease protein